MIKLTKSKSDIWNILDAIGILTMDSVSTVNMKIRSKAVAYSQSPIPLDISIFSQLRDSYCTFIYFSVFIILPVFQFV